MAPLSDSMLGAQPRGAQLKCLQAPASPIINSPDNVFHGSVVLQGFPPVWPWNGQINTSSETNWNYTPRCLNIRMHKQRCPGSDCRLNIEMCGSKCSKKNNKKKQKGLHVRMYSYPYILFCSTGNLLMYASVRVWRGEILQPCRGLKGFSSSLLLHFEWPFVFIYFFVQLLRSVMKNTFLKNGWIWKKIQI